MDTLSLIFIAIGLSIDSLAVSITNGFTIKSLKKRNIFWIAILFASLQALMPLLGWCLGIGLEKYIVAFDHWIAFVLLLSIGLKMIIDGISKKENVEELKPGTLVFIGQGIATSIDALVIGVSLALLDNVIIKPILIIGISTFIFSIAGHFLGKYYGRKLKINFEYIGGLILISIGLKILIEHLFF